jgi:hypothetical protein
MSKDIKEILVSDVAAVAAIENGSDVLLYIPRNYPHAMDVDTSGCDREGMLEVRGRFWHRRTGYEWPHVATFKHGRRLVSLRIDQLRYDCSDAVIALVVDEVTVAAAVG